MLPGITPHANPPRLTPVWGGNDQYTKLLFHFDDTPQGVNAFANSAANPSKPLSIATNGNNSSGSPLPGGGYSLACQTANGYAALQQTNVQADLDFGTGDFTIDWWEYRVSAPNNSVMVSRDINASYQAFILGYSSGTNLTVYMSSNGATWDICSAIQMGVYAFNQWNHQAICRLGTVFGAWQNGSLHNTWNSSAALFPTAGSLGLGCWSAATSAIFNGQFYMEELRVSKGISRWTPGANFAVRSHAPYDKEVTYGNDGSTVLLLHFDQSLVDDAKGSRPPKTFTLQGGAALVTSDSKFGGGCLSLGLTTTSRITCPNNTDFDFGAGAFTVDLWIKRTGAIPGPLGFIFSKRALAAEWAPVQFVDNGTNILCYATTNGSGWDIMSGVALIATPPLNVWTHLAFVRYGNSLLSFRNGILQTCQPFAGTIWANNNIMSIGGLADGTYTYPGLFDEFRVSRAARWIENFYTADKMPQGY